MVDHPDATPVDLIGAAGPSVAKRLLPLLAAVVAILALVGWRRRRSRAER
jgi:hypothetical protein